MPTGRPEGRRTARPRRRQPAAAPAPGRGQSCRAPGDPVWDTCWSPPVRALLRPAYPRRMRPGLRAPSHRPVKVRAAGAARSGTMEGVSGLADLPVAVFDSGVGGLTVLHELLVSLPTEDYVYLGDTARFPYGDRSPGELEAFAIEIADHLLDAGAKVLVAACNAVSSAALLALERHLERSGRDV